MMDIIKLFMIWILNVYQALTADILFYFVRPIYIFKINMCIIC